MQGCVIGLKLMTVGNPSTSIALPLCRVTFHLVVSNNYLAFAGCRFAFRKSSSYRCHPFSQYRLCHCPSGLYLPSVSPPSPLCPRVSSESSRRGHHHRLVELSLRSMLPRWDSSHLRVGRPYVGHRNPVSRTNFARLVVSLALQGFPVCSILSPIRPGRCSACLSSSVRRVMSGI